MTEHLKHLQTVPLTTDSLMDVCWSYLGLFALHDSNTRVGGSQVNADHCALDGFRPETDTPEDDGRRLTLTPRHDDLSVDILKSRAALLS